MNTHSINLDRLRIATPCPIGWEQMNGDNRVRFCGHCQLNVYNISELSRSEAEALIASTEGRLCAKLFRRADGTILTKECPVGLRAVRMRVSKKAAAVFAAMVSLVSVIFGQQSSDKFEKSACTPQARISRTNPESAFAGAVLSGTLVDPNGGIVGNASITVTNLDSNKTDTTTSNDQGRFEFKSIAAGSYSIKIQLLGFKSFLVNNLQVEKDKLTNVDLILELDNAVQTIGIVDMSFEPVDTHTPLVTIINEQMIRRLPIQ
jgi:hypothetical protein